MRVKLSSDLLDELDVSAAVQSAVNWPPEFFPSRVIENAVENRIEDVADYLTGIYRRGFDVAEAEVLFAQKSARGLRPIAAVPLRERVLMHALDQHTSSRLPTWQRDSTAYEAFQKEPAEVVGDYGYVLLADVANFYEYVDHQLLLDQLVDETGEAEVADSLGVLLGGLMGRAFGLPQGYRFSDSLSEVFINPAERRLIRRGWPTWRFADDFRIAVEDWARVHEATEDLIAELRSLGLHLNEEKLITVGGAKYSDWINDPDTKLREVADEVEIDLEGWSPYVGQQLDTPEDETVVAAAGQRALELWDEMTHPDKKLSGLELWVYRRLARTGLGYLRATRSPGGLALVRRLIQREPQMTDLVARYLTDLIDQDHDAVNGALQEIVESTRLSGWQSLWLFEIPIRDQDSPTWTSDWLRPAVGIGGSEAVRARACLALASNGAADSELVARVFETVGPAARADVAEAAALLGSSGSTIADTIRNENPILGWIVEDATAEETVEAAIEEAPF